MFAPTSIIADSGTSVISDKQLSESLADNFWKLNVELMKSHKDVAEIIAAVGVDKSVSGGGASHPADDARQVETRAQVFSICTPTTVGSCILPDAPAAPPPWVSAGSRFGELRTEYSNRKTRGGR